MKSNSIIKSSFWVLVIIGLGKLFSFARDIVISSKFGSTYQTDAYFAANNIPSIIFTAIISSYIILLIPTYKKIQLLDGTLDANLFVSRVITLLFLFSITLTFLGYFFIENLIFIVAPGFDQQTTELAVILGKVLVLSFPLSSVTLVLATISNANNKFYAPHIIPLTSSFIVILGALLFADDYGIIVIALAGVFSFFIQLIIQSLISQSHFKYVIHKKILDRNLKKMTFLLLPIFLGYSVDQINLLVNSILSSGLSEGSLSSLNYAQRLQATINGTLSTALITVIYPLLSRLIAENKIKELTAIMTQSLRGVFIVLIPVVVYLGFYSKQFVSLIYYRGQFDELALEQTSSVFFFYAFNVIFISLREVLLRLYYVKNNTRIPFYTSVLSLIINIVLSLLLLEYMAVSGLALANLIATVISAFALLALVSSKLQIQIRMKNLYIFARKIFFPITLFFVYSLVVYLLFEIGTSIVSFSLGFIISVIFYFSLLLLFKQQDVLFFIKMLNQKMIK